MSSNQTELDALRGVVRLCLKAGFLCQHSENGYRIKISIDEDKFRFINMSIVDQIRGLFILELISDRLVLPGNVLSSGGFLFTMLFKEKGSDLGYWSINGDKDLAFLFHTTIVLDNLTANDLVSRIILVQSASDKLQSALAIMAKGGY